MPTQLLLTRFLNAHFAAPVDGAAACFACAAGVSAGADYECVCDGAAGVSGCCCAYFVAVRASLSVEKPGAVQHLAEMTHEFVSEQGEQIIGHGFERFIGYLTALLLFILLATCWAWFRGWSRRRRMSWCRWVLRW